MRRSLRQATHSLGHIFRTQASQFRNTFSLCEFRYRRTASHCRNTTLGAKTNLQNSVVFNDEGKLQNVPARWILHPCSRIRPPDLSGISRVLKMIQQSRSVHNKIVA